jgi:hypothetical protein
MGWWSDRRNNDDQGGLWPTVREGSWEVRSLKDPRFDMNGRGLVGCFCLPPSADYAIKAKAKELGVEVPDDIEFRYMKD